MDPLVAFTAEQVSRLTGLSLRQLRYWDDEGFFAPSYARGERRTPYNRIYRFRDVVGLRTIAILRKQYRVGFMHLREVGCWLKERYDEPWATLRFFVVGRQVIFEDPRTKLLLKPTSPSQVLLPIEMQTIEHEARARALQLREREPDEIGKITRHRYVVSNAWVLAGTRIPTAAIWNFRAAGYDLETILAAYPSLTPTDVQRAIEFEQQRRNQTRAS